jgi:hypothetical protein
MFEHIHLIAGVEEESGFCVEVSSQQEGYWLPK